MSIIKKAIILILTQESPETICDFAYQTTLLLSKNKNLVIYFYTQGKSIKEIIIDFIKNKKYFSYFFKENNLYFLNKIEFLPFKRFKLIRKINLIINIILLKILIIFLGGKYNLKIIWLFHPNESIFLSYFKKLTSLYDAIDYHTSLDEKENQLLRDKENFILKNANIVTTISYSLYNLYKKKGAKVFIVPQGFAVNEFKKFQNLRINLKLPQNKPLIGFIGAINYRLDFKLLINLLKNNPQWSFVFIGPREENIDQLRSLPNLFYHPSQEKKYIPTIINQFNTCLIPYDIKNPFNKYCYPMKVFEYFYMGKPVISTPILELKRLQPYVVIAKDAKEFERAIKNILKNGWPEKYKKEQKKLAIANSWQLKIEKISNILKKEFPEKFYD